MLTRRDFLWSVAGVAAAAAAGSLLADRSLRPPVLPPPLAQGYTPVLLRTDTTEGRQFAQGLRAAGLRLDERPWDAHLEAPQLQCEMLRELPAGTRVFAFVQDRDAVLIESLLGHRLRAQWHRAHHAAGPSASRHAIANAGTMDDLALRFVERLERSAHGYAVRRADGRDLQPGPVARTSAPGRPWPAELAALLADGGTAHPIAHPMAQPAALSLASATLSAQRGCCDDVPHRYVSLLVDL